MIRKPSFLKPKEIAGKADEFRQLYVTPPEQIPLDLEHIIENVLRIRIDPRKNLSRISRRSDLAIDAYLTSDRSTIVVDLDQFTQDQGRLKFTLAHELGHWFLHKNEYKSVKYDTEEDFIKIQKSLDAKYRNWFEFQANEFAAVLLVPSNVLMNLSRRYLPDLKKFLKANGPEQLWLMKNEIAEDLAQSFDVSPEVVKNRMNNEQILESFLEL
jgi:Zn-dependent peptidase ImmA (M78 family)